MIIHFARRLLLAGARINRRFIRECGTAEIPATNTKSYEVSPRCTINGFLCFKTIVIPHDVNNTAESDKLIMKCSKPITVNIIGTALNLTTSREEVDSSTVCELHVPLKANINLTSLGDLKMGNLEGDGVRAFSEMGKITLGNLKCNEILAGTNNHDIITDGNLEATRMEFLCRGTGSIKAQKIKAMGLKLETNEGDISMNACYSKHGYFLTKKGNMQLKNIHNRCRIETLFKSKINVVGLEGALECSLQNGFLDIQIQKLFDSSDILIREEGEVTLRIPQELLDYVEIMVWSKGCYVDDALPFTEDEINDLTTIKKKDAKTEHTLRVRCKKATCNVHLASWVDMIEKQFIEKKQQEENTIQQSN